MSYYACGDGTVIFEPVEGISREEIEDDLMEQFGDVSVIETKDHLELDIRYEYQNYDEDKLCACISKYAKTVIEGGPEFVGEDDSHWLLIYENGEWVEKNGMVVYTTPADDVYELLKKKLEKPDLICGEDDESRMYKAQALFTTYMLLKGLDGDVKAQDAEANALYDITHTGEKDNSYYEADKTNFVRFMTGILQ